MKKASNIASFCLIILLCIAQPLLAANIVQIAMDERGIPFVLDDDGHVWGFKLPYAMQNPTRLEGLERIIKIAPYIAVDFEGKAYTWSLNDAEIETVEGEIETVGFTTPQRVDGLSDVTMVARSNNHIFAVRNNREIYVIPIIRDKFMYGMSRLGGIKKLIDREGIVSIAAAPGTHSVLTSESDTFGLSVLFKDGTVMGWGVSSSGQLAKVANSDTTTLAKLPGATSIAMNAFHTVVLTSDGIPKYWGGCDLYGDLGDNKHYEEEPEKVLGKGGYINEVVEMALAQDINYGVAGGWGQDSSVANIFIKRDGSVWLSFAPTPEGETGKYGCGQYLQSVNYHQARKLVAGASKAIQVVTAQGMYLMLDEDHQLWQTGNYGPVEFFPKKVDLK